MITSLNIGDKIRLKIPTNIFEEISIPTDLSVDDTYTVSEIHRHIMDNSIIHIGIKESPYLLYCISLFETSLKFERNQKLKKLKKYETK